jgi:hypothetical protein
MDRMYRILVICLIVLLSLPGLQYITGIFKIKPLNGVINEPKIVPFTMGSYLNFEYQTSVLKFIDRHFGFRPFFIRLYNQIDFSLFNIPHSAGVVIGKDDYLYEEWYIKDYLGYYFVGKPKIEEKVNQFSEIRHFLKQYNTELMLMLNPGKGWYYPEYIPDYFVRKTDFTNYQTYVDVLKISDVPYFDVNGWFMEMKKTLPYPLFTKTGTHWSEYGAKLTADSLIKQCEVILDKRMNRIHLKGIEWSKIPRKTDNDLEKILNLFFSIPQNQMAYPIIEKENILPKEDMPSVIVISDSFYWNMFDGILENSFRSNEYWYYYNSIYPKKGNPQLTVKDIDVFGTITNVDLVILMMSTAGLFKFGDGFVTDVLPIVKYNDKAIKGLLIQGLIEQINHSKPWMEVIREKAQARNIPVDSMIFLDANYLAERKITARNKQKGE